MGRPADADQRLKRAEWEVRPIKGQGEPWQNARRFVAEHHYSGGCTKTATYVHGLYRKGEDELFGVSVWIPPTMDAAISVNKPHWRLVLSLSRLAIRAEVPANAASFLLARSVKLIRSDGRFVSLVTYADTYMNHHGGIYRATNWTYVGLSSAKTRWEDVEGRQVSDKANVYRSAAKMVELGYRRVGSFRKHKFVMHLGDPIPVAITSDELAA